MSATPTRLPRSKTFCRPTAEPLEDRLVLSASGLLSLADQLVAPPLSSLLRTATDLTAALPLSVGLSPVGADLTLRQEPALLSSKPDGGLFGESPAAQTANAPASSQVIASALPTLTIALDVLGIGLEIQTESSTSIVAPSETGSSVGVSVHANEPGVTPTVGTTGAGLNGQGNQANGAAPNVGGNAKPVAPTSGASAPTGAKATPLINAEGLLGAVPPAPTALANPGVAVPANETGPAAAPIEILLAGNGESPLPGAPNVRAAEPGLTERDSLSPQAAGLLFDTLGVDPAAMEIALQQFLDQLDDLGQDVGGWLTIGGPTSCVAMSLAIAVVAGELARRRLQQAQSKKVATETARRDALRRFPAFTNLKEES